MLEDIHAKTLEHYSILQRLMRDQQKAEAKSYLQGLMRSYPAASLLAGPLASWCRGEYSLEFSRLGLLLYRKETLLSGAEQRRLEELFAQDKPNCVFMVVDRFLPDRHYKLADGVSCITIDGGPREDFSTCLVHELAHAVFDAGNRLLNEGLAVYFERKAQTAEQRPLPPLPVGLLSLLDTPLPYVEFHDLFPEWGAVYYQAAGDLVEAILLRSGLEHPAAFLRAWQNIPGELPSERLAALIDADVLPLRPPEPKWQRADSWLDERLKSRDFFREPAQAAAEFIAWANTLEVDDELQQRDLGLVMVLLALASRQQLTRLQLDAIRVHATAFHRRLELSGGDSDFVRLLGALLRILDAMESRSPTDKRKKMEQANHELESLGSHPTWGGEARRVLSHTGQRPGKGHKLNNSEGWANAAETLLQTGVAKQLADYTGINAQIYDYRHVMAHDINFYLKHLVPRSRILELGCGTGRVTKALVEYGMTVTGVDLSGDMLALCRARLKGLDSQAYRLIQGDMTSVVTEEAYDAVIIPYSSFSLLENHQRRLQALQHVKGMLNPDATVYIDYEAPDPYVQVSPLGITHVSAFPSEQGSWMEVWLVRHDPIRNLKVQDISNFSLSRDGTYEAHVTKTVESYLSPAEVRLLVEQAGLQEKACIRSYGLDSRSDFAIGNRFMTTCRL